MWLLEIPPQLKYGIIVPCNSLITALACDCRSFSDINILQGNVATHEVRWDFNKNFAENLPENLTVKKIETGWELAELWGLLPRVLCLTFLEHGIYNKYYGNYNKLFNSMDEINAMSVFG